MREAENEYPEIRRSDDTGKKNTKMPEITDKKPTIKTSWLDKTVPGWVAVVMLIIILVFSLYLAVQIVYQWIYGHPLKSVFCLAGLIYLWHLVFKAVHDHPEK